MSKHPMESLTLDKLIGKFKEIEDENAELKAQVERMRPVASAAVRWMAAIPTTPLLAMAQYEAAAASMAQAGEALRDAAASYLRSEPDLLLDPTESKVS